MRVFASALSFFFLTLSYPGISLSEGGNAVTSWPDAPSIHIQVDAQTWKTRGRLYWDVEGSLIKKLAATGFKIVRSEAKPHHLTFKVLYREERGEQYDINAYGTVIHGTFALEPTQNNAPLELTISETSRNLISGTPPYLDALDKFQTNPYYFFIGEILRGNVEKGLDSRGGLIYALEQVVSLKNSDRSVSRSTDRDAGSYLHTMVSEREIYEPRAIGRAIDDCVGANDRRIIPILSQLLTHPDSTVRIETINAMGSFEVEESRSRLLQMAHEDPDRRVRETANIVEKRLGTPHESTLTQP